MFPLSGNRKEPNELVSDGKVGVGVVSISSVTCVVVVVVLISGLILRLGDNSREVADVGLLVSSVAKV